MTRFTKTAGIGAIRKWSSKGHIGGRECGAVTPGRPHQGGHRVCTRSSSVRLRVQDELHPRLVEAQLGVRIVEDSVALRSAAEASRALGGPIPAARLRHAALAACI